MCRRSIAALVLLIAADAAFGQAGTEDAVPEPPIIIDSESNFYDMRAGVTRFNDNVTIQRGPMLVNADQGVVRQAEGQITEIELTGSPTTWRDTLEDGTVVTGEARRIHFDVAENVVTLTGNARLVHERGEYTGDELVYDLDTENLAGRGSNGNRVRVIIEPEAMQEGAGAITGQGDQEPAPDDAEDAPPDEDSGEPPAEEPPAEDPPAGR